MAAIVLTVCIGGQVFGYLTQTDSVAASSAMALDRLPENLPGWNAENLPLGATEAVDEAAQRVLGLDAYIHREFVAGSLIVDVYVAYWRPGNASFRNVAPHTPDVCWINSGWRCEKRHSSVDTEMFDPGGNSVSLPPVEWREFFAPQSNSPTYVIFWNVVGGRVGVDVAERNSRKGSLGKAISWWWREASQIWRGRPEQYFIRLTSNVPFDQIWDDPGVQQIVAALAKLGLAERSGDNPEGGGQTAEDGAIQRTDG